MQRFCCIIARSRAKRRVDAHDEETIACCLYACETMLARDRNALLRRAAMLGRAVRSEMLAVGSLSQQQQKKKKKKKKKG